MTPKYLMRFHLLLLVLFALLSCNNEGRETTILNVHVKELAENKNLEGETVTLYYDGFSSKYAINETKQLGPDNRASFEFIGDKSGGYWIRFDDCCNLWIGGPSELREQNVIAAKQNDIELNIYSAGRLSYRLENWDNIDEKDYCHLTITHALISHTIDNEGAGYSPYVDYDRWSGWYDFDWYVVKNGDTTYHHDSKYLEQGGNLEFIVKY